MTGEVVPESHRVQELTRGLREAEERISLYYDEVFHEVAGRASQAESVGKADIGALVVWKRLRADTPWVSKLMSLPDRDVRAATREAIAIARVGPVANAASDSRESLRQLPGFSSGTALASAVLTAACPERLAVYDRRAKSGLNYLGLTLTGKEERFYGLYMHLVEQCRSEMAAVGRRATARQIDLALFMLGGPTSSEASPRR